MEKLRRERAQVVDDEMDQTPSGPRLNYPRSCFTCAERPQKITTDERLKSTRPAKGNAEA
jgi:hypothetical protein